MRDRNARYDRRQLAPLELLPGFEAVARHLSFTLAADELALTQSAVSRQIRALEDHLGVVLFERGHRTLQLTPAGQILLSAATPLLDGITDAVRRARAAFRPDGPVTVTTTPGFASLWLIPRLGEYARAHRDADIRISATNDLIDLERHDVDVAVRFLSPKDTVPEAATLLFEERIFPVCAPGVQSTLTSVEALSHQTILVLEREPGVRSLFDWEPWLAAMAAADFRPDRVVYYRQYHEIIAAAMAGQGVAMGRLPLLADLLHEGRLVAALGTPRESARAYFLVPAVHAAHRPAVQQFCRWLVETAQSSRRDMSSAARPEY